MAAVAPAQYEARAVSREYGTLRCEAETTGDESFKVRLARERSVRINNRVATEISGTESQVGSREKDDRQSGGETGAGVANLSNGISPHDDAAAEEEFSTAEKSGAEVNIGSDKNLSDDDSVIAEDWEGGGEAADTRDVEVANRNNCMSVFLHLKLLPEVKSLSKRSFCKRDEEHDPSEEHEEYMACAVCGDNCKLRSFWNSPMNDLASWISRYFLNCRLTENAAHRKCARDAKSFSSDEGFSPKLYFLI